MNVTCTGCPAKYSVPDEKVRGKKVRITCKHCGTNIVVDGSALGGTAAQSVLPQVEPEPAPVAAAAPKATATPLASPKPAAEPAPAPAAAKPSTEATWLVGFIDERQEQHSTSGVVDLYKAGKIDDETLVWKDGMDNWLSPFDVPEIAAVMKQRGVARRAPSFALSPAADDEPTVVGRSPFEEETVVSSAPSEAAKPTAVKSPISPAVAAIRQSSAETKPAAAGIRQSTPEIKPAAAAIRQSTPEIKPAAAAIRQSAPELSPAAAKPVVAAARRAEKRPEVDLFGGVADAGSEADSSLDFGVPEEAAHKMTGARNESSVLFSLDALTKPETKAAGQKRTQDKQKEKDASAVLFGDSAPDSLMNMGGGGGLAALAAPDFTKPVSAEPAPVRPSDPVEVPNAAPGKKKGGAGIVIGIVIGVAAAAGVAFVMMSKKPAEPTAAEPKTATAATPTAATPTDTAAAPTPAPEAPSAAPAASAETPAASASAGGAKPAPGAATAAAAATPAAGVATVNKPAEKPTDAKKPDAAPAAPAAPAAGADFDKSAAIAALGAAAANAASCKKPDGPTGAGKASVTFAPSGRATNSTVTGAFAGTDVGGCVARIFRSAKIPPFSGDPVTVSKSFSIE